MLFSLNFLKILLCLAVSGRFNEFTLFQHQVKFHFSATYATTDLNVHSDLRNMYSDVFLWPLTGCFFTPYTICQNSRKLNWNHSFPLLHKSLFWPLTPVFWPMHPVCTARENFNGPKYKYFIPPYSTDNNKILLTRSSSPTSRKICRHFTFCVEF